MWCSGEMGAVKTNGDNDDTRYSRANAWWRMPLRDRCRGRPGRSGERTHAATTVELIEHDVLPSATAICVAALVQSMPSGMSRSVRSDLAQLGEWIGAVTGRDVTLAPWRTSPSAPPKSAALISVDGRIVIRFDARRSERHLLQDIMHEVGHVLCGHVGGQAVSAGLLSAGLDLAMIEAVVQRHALDAEAEQEAEQVGTALALASGHILRLDMAGLPWRSTATAEWIAARRARILRPMWTDVTSACPEVCLGPIEPSAPNRYAAHRMLVEIEDAVMTLAPLLDLNAEDSATSRAQSISEALVRWRAGTVTFVDGPSPWWPHDEGAVLATARAWTRLPEQRQESPSAA